MRFASQTAENNLRVVYVCPYCGWWKAKPFECRHMVTATDGEPAFRDYRGERCTFYLTQHGDSGGREVAVSGEGEGAR